MNLSPDWISAAAQPIATTVIAIATYGTFALVFALLVERFWKTASSADRHGLWLLALLAGTLGPILTQVVIPPVPPKDTLPEWVTVRYDLRKNVVAQATPASTPLPSAVTSAIPPSLNPTLSHSLQSPVPHSTITLTSDSARILASIASTGSLVLFIRMFLGSWLLHRLGRRSKPLGDEDWQQLLDRLQKQLGIRRTINLRIHPSETIPLTWGHRRPVVLLPQSAAQWSDERREAVLLHELAHIRRWDCATHGLAAFLQAIAWFHPIAWIALRRLNLEREQACDDWVVNSGTKPSLYAEHLLELSRRCTPHRTHDAIAMAQPHRLSTRVTAILDPRRCRNRSPLRLALVACTLVVGTTLPRPTVLAAEPANPATTSTNALSRPSPTRAELAERGLRNIEMALTTSQEKQALLNSELDALKEKLGITDLMVDNAQPATPSPESPLPKLDQLALDVRIRITREESSLGHLKALPSSELPDVLLTLYPEDQLLQHLSIRKEAAESETEITLARHGAASPEHKVALDRVRSYQKKIDQRIEGILRSREIQLKTLRMELDDLSKATEDARKIAMERAPAYRRYFEKKRELENERLMGDVLMRKIAQVRFDAQIPPVQLSVPVQVPDSPLQRP